MEQPTQLERARFMDKVAVQPNGCHLWTGAKTKCVTAAGRRHKISGGYGLFHWHGQNRRVHRLIWEWDRGPIPDGLTVEHACHTSDPTCSGGEDCVHRSCVNLGHLALQTRQENRQAHKTHCKRGHEFTAENTRTNAKGQRNCRKCLAYLARRAYRRKHG